MKPHIHAESSAKLFGGQPSDYIKIHQWFDATKAHFSDNRHRVLRHHTFGIFECAEIFGDTIKNSDGKVVSVRDIGEQHVTEDLGFIPTVSDYLQNMEYVDWMAKRTNPDKNIPPSLNKIKEKINEEKEDDISIHVKDVIYDGSRSLFDRLSD